MIENTSAEIRHMYRKINPDMPSDEVLEYRYGDATIGAGEWLIEQGIVERGEHDVSEDK